MITHWTAIELVDGDNHPVTGAFRLRKLAEYRNTNAMQGAFFVNPETGEGGDWDYAPDIDWTDWEDSATTDLF